MVPGAESMERTTIMYALKKSRIIPFGGFPPLEPSMYGFNLELKQGFFLVSGLRFVTWDSRRAVGMARGFVLLSTTPTLICMTSKRLCYARICVAT